ncbi:MAG: dTDP-4-dehydrorhamnose reductase [Flavobacteriaceae bacterium]|nr:dTDP-4-dehydrorhamnose reductase [Flavobacteriaceae bacterium]
MYKILVTGSKGQLGSELRELSCGFQQYHFFFTDIEELDITNKARVQEFISVHQVNAIINCAAYTNVDKAESELAKAYEINHLAVKYLAEVSIENNCKLVHISTDYVFDGIQSIPYLETDKTNPQGVYGSSKLAGELAMIHVNPLNSIIIRTSWVYSTFGNNFVKTMMTLGNTRDEINVIDDQFGSPTYAMDLAQVILELLPKINNSNVEIYHFSNEGECSWFDFATAIFHFANINCKVNPIDTSQYPTAAKRPPYSILNKSKIKETYKIVIPFWKDSLKDCIGNMNNLK